MILGDEEISFLKKKKRNKYVDFLANMGIEKIKSGVSMHGMIIIYILNS